jgi:hypothetical protein
VSRTPPRPTDAKAIIAAACLVSMKIRDRQLPAREHAIEPKVARAEA